MRYFYMISHSYDNPVLNRTKSRTKYQSLGLTLLNARSSNFLQATSNECIGYPILIILNYILLCYLLCPDNWFNVLFVKHLVALVLKFSHVILPALSTIISLFAFLLPRWSYWTRKHLKCLECLLNVAPHFMLCALHMKIVACKKDCVNLLQETTSSSHLHSL